MRRLRRFRLSERGQTLIEFSLIMPMVFFFLFIMVDFGIAMDKRLVLQHAVREGARTGAVNGNLSFGAGSVQYIAAHQAQGVISANDVIVCYTDMNGDGNIDVGDAVDVCEKSFSYDPFMIRGGPFGITIPKIDMFLTGSARLEQKPTAPSDVRCPCP